MGARCSARSREGVGHPPIRLFRSQGARLAKPLERCAVAAVHETDVTRIQRVLEILKVIAIAYIGVGLNVTVKVLKFGVEWECRRPAFAEVTKNEAKILANWI